MMWLWDLGNEGLYKIGWINWLVRSGFYLKSGDKNDDSDGTLFQSNGHSVPGGWR